MRQPCLMLLILGRHQTLVIKTNRFSPSNFDQDRSKDPTSITDGVRIKRNVMSRIMSVHTEPITYCQECQKTSDCRPTNQKISEADYKRTADSSAFATEYQK